MTDYLVLTDFVPGTKAKAQEVNANFSAVKDAINSKATVEGDSTQAFSVAEAIDDTHAVTKSQLDAVADEFTQKINATAPKFCAKSGNVTAGKSDLFSYSSLTITSKVGGACPKLVISDCNGVFTEISLVADLSMSGKPDGVYNLFAAADGVLYALKNAIYRQESRPTMLEGDVWFNTSKEPTKAVKYNGTSDVEFLGVPLGRVTVVNSAITKIETFAFNDNGYDITTHTALVSGTTFAKSISSLIMPDYSKGINKALNTVHTASSDGYLFVYGCSSYNTAFVIDGASFQIGSALGAGNVGQGGGMFVAKDSTYYVVSAYSLVFYPVKNS